MPVHSAPSPFAPARLLQRASDHLQRSDAGRKARSRGTPAIYATEWWSRKAEGRSTSEHTRCACCFVAAALWCDVVSSLWPFVCVPSALISTGIRYVFGELPLEHSLHPCLSFASRLPFKESKLPAATAIDIITAEFMDKHRTKHTCRSINTAHTIQWSQTRQLDPVQVLACVDHVRSVVEGQDAAFPEPVEFWTVYSDAQSSTDLPPHSDALAELGKTAEDECSFDLLRGVGFRLPDLPPDTDHAFPMDHDPSFSLHAARQPQALPPRMVECLSPLASLVRKLFPSLACTEPHRAGPCCVSCPPAPLCPVVASSALGDVLKLLSSSMHVEQKLAHGQLAHPWEPWARFAQCTDEQLTDTIETAIRRTSGTPQARTTPHAATQIEAHSMDELANPAVASAASSVAFSSAVSPSAASSSAIPAACASSTSSSCRPPTRFSMVLRRSEGLTKCMVRRTTHAHEQPGQHRPRHKHSHCDPMLTVLAVVAPLCAQGYFSHAMGGLFMQHVEGQSFRLMLFTQRLKLHCWIRRRAVADWLPVLFVAFVFVLDSLFGSALKMVEGTGYKIIFMTGAEHYESFKLYLRNASLYPSRGSLEQLSDAEVRGKLGLHFPPPHIMRRFGITIHVLHPGQLIVIPPAVWHWSDCNLATKQLTNNNQPSASTERDRSLLLVYVCSTQGHQRGYLGEPFSQLHLPDSSWPDRGLQSLRCRPLRFCVPSVGLPVERLHTRSCCRPMRSFSRGVWRPVSFLPSPLLSGVVPTRGAVRGRRDGVSGLSAQRTKGNPADGGAHAGSATSSVRAMEEANGDRGGRKASVRLRSTPQVCTRCCEERAPQVAQSALVSPTPPFYGCCIVFLARCRLQQWR